MTVAEALKDNLPEVTYKEGGCHTGIRILHLAEKERGYAYALCGRKRDSKLDPGADGELCVVCAEVYWRKHGREYGK